MGGPLEYHPQLDNRLTLPIGTYSVLAIVRTAFL